MIPTPENVVRTRRKVDVFLGLCIVILSSMVGTMYAVEGNWTMAVLYASVMLFQIRMMMGRL